jgi:hypothetical protein
MDDRKAFLEWIWTDLINGADPHSVAVGGTPPDEPFADATEALGRIRAAGAAVEDIARILRAERYEAAFRLLFQIFERELSGTELHGLHESLLSADPSGLEGRPGSWPRSSR